MGLVSQAAGPLMGLRFKNSERQRPAGADMGSNRGNHGGNLRVETMDTCVDTVRVETVPPTPVGLPFPWVEAGWWL